MSNDLRAGSLVSVEHCFLRMEMCAPKVSCLACILSYLQHSLHTPNLPLERSPLQAVLIFCYTVLFRNKRYRVKNFYV